MKCFGSLFILFLKQKVADGKKKGLGPIGLDLKSLSS